MEFDKHAMEQLHKFLTWVVKNKEDINNFYANALFAFEPYYVLSSNMSFKFLHGFKMIVPFNTCCDINSVKIMYWEEYLNTTD